MGNLEAQLWESAADGGAGRLASWLQRFSLADDNRQQSTASLPPTSLNIAPWTNSRFERDVLRTLWPIRIRVDVSGSNGSFVVRILTVGRPSAKRQRITDGAKILLDIAKESSDWFGPLKSALGGMNALIKHYEVIV